jgi:hypothetical protein
MMNFIDKICDELEFETLSVREFMIEDDLYLNFELRTLNHFEYFIFIELAYDKLDLVLSKIQIALFTKLKAHLNRQKNNREFRVTHFFDNNTTVVISTDVTTVENNDDTFKTISRIEEDPFYFKKQILYYRDSEKQYIIDALDTTESVIQELNAIVTDSTTYELHTYGLDSSFDFVTRIYAKLPFLQLKLEQQKLSDLDEMIDTSLTKNELKIVEEILSLDTETNIDEWIETLGADND